MFIAINRFAVTLGREADFESAWKSRVSYLSTVPGFIRFSLLKGDEPGEYLSHTTWNSRGAFDDWTRSEAFRAGHGQTAMAGVLAGHPRVSLYEALLEQDISV